MIYLPLITTLWATWGEACGQPAEMRCTSGAHVSAERSGAGWLQADVWMESAPDGRGFASVAINGDLAADNRCELARVVMGVWRYELVCVGVNPGESGHNPALCRFWNVRAG